MKRVLLVVASMTFLVGSGVFSPTAPAAGGLGMPSVTSAGTWGGIRYVEYDGIFAGTTSTGGYRVPYRITAPGDPERGNGTVLVEPPHFASGTGTLDQALGRDFLFSRGFSHASVGYSTTDFGDGANLRILDPSVRGVFIHGGFDDEGGRTDDEIIVDFARALTSDPFARRMLGTVGRRYLTGFSDSSVPVLRLVTSGLADRVFDVALPYTATTGPYGSWDGPDPQAALAAGRFAGKLVIVNSENEGTSAPLVDRGVVPRQYRFYAVAGSPHVPDFLVPFFSNETSPASFQPELRARFLQAHDWVIRGEAPPASTHLLAAGGDTLARDASGNAISVDVRGRLMPRLPFVELGEAHFVSDFLGSYDGVKTIAQLGFNSPGQYLRAFAGRLAAYADAGGILREDAAAMLRRAALCPPLTYTETYRDHYDRFVAVQPCGR